MLTAKIEKSEESGLVPQLFLGAPWAENVTLSPKIPKGKSCDTSQNFPTGHTKFLAWSECLIQKKSPGSA